MNPSEATIHSVIFPFRVHYWLLSSIKKKWKNCYENPSWAPQAHRIGLIDVSLESLSLSWHSSTQTSSNLSTLAPYGGAFSVLTASSSFLFQMNWDQGNNKTRRENSIIWLHMIFSSHNFFLLIALKVEGHESVYLLCPAVQKTSQDVVGAGKNNRRISPQGFGVDRKGLSKPGFHLAAFWWDQPGINCWSTFFLNQNGRTMFLFSIHALSGFTWRFVLCFIADAGQRTVTVGYRIQRWTIYNAGLVSCAP